MKVVLKFNLSPILERQVLLNSCQKWKLMLIAQLMRATFGYRCEARPVIVNSIETIQNGLAKINGRNTFLTGSCPWVPFCKF